MSLSLPVGNTSGSLCDERIGLTITSLPVGNTSGESPQSRMSLTVSQREPSRQGRSFLQTINASVLVNASNLTVSHLTGANCDVKAVGGALSCGTDAGGSTVNDSGIFRQAGINLTALNVSIGIGLPMNCDFATIKVSTEGSNQSRDLLFTFNDDNQTNNP
jgi:hypothetical protein